MREFESLPVLYKKHKLYERNVILVPIVILVMISLFVGLNLFRVNTFMLYFFGMGAAICYVMRTRVESNYYRELKRYLKKEMPEVYQNKELLFYIDYHLVLEYAPEASQLFGDLKNEQNQEKLKSLVEKITKMQQDNFKKVGELSDF